MNVRLSKLVTFPLLAVALSAQTTPDIKIEPVPSPDVLRSEAFEAAQYAQISGAAAALDKTTARFAAGGGPLAVLEQERDKKLAEIANRFAKVLELWRP